MKWPAIPVQLLANWLQCRPRMERIFCFVASKQSVQCGWSSERLLEHRRAEASTERGRRDESPRGSGDEIEIVTYSRVSFVNPAQWRAQLHPRCPLRTPLWNLDSFLLLCSVRLPCAERRGRETEQARERRKQDVEWNRRVASCEGIHVDFGSFYRALTWLCPPRRGGS